MSGPIKWGNVMSNLQATRVNNQQGGGARRRPRRRHAITWPTTAVNSSIALVTTKTTLPASRCTP